MVISKLKDIYDDENIWLYRLDKELRKKVLKDTYFWMPWYKERIKSKVETVLKTDEKLNNNNNKNNNSNNDNSNHWTFSLAPEDRDEYIPQDMEIWESMWEAPHIFEISPYLQGYYTWGRKSYYDEGRLIWSKKKNLTWFSGNVDKTKSSYTFSWRVWVWIISIPLPNNALPDIDSLVSTNKSVKFYIDQNSCIYIKSKSKWELAFDFYVDQYENNNEPIEEDSEKIFNWKFKPETERLIYALTNTSVYKGIDKIKKLEDYIKSTKKYDEKAQWKLYSMSDSSNYFINLDNAELLECYSANTLLVSLLRRIWIKSRLVVWHHISTKWKNWKSNIWQNTGHAWTEAWDEKTSTWLRFDATPPWLNNSNWNNTEESNDWDDSENNNDSNYDKNQGNQGDKSDNSNDDNNQDNQGDSDNKESNKKNEDDLEKYDENDWKKCDWNCNIDNWKWLIKWNNNWNKLSPKEALDEMIKTLEKEEDKKQEEELGKQKQELEKQKEIEHKIYDWDKEELEKTTNIQEIDYILAKSILQDEEIKKKLKSYAEKLKDNIDKRYKMKKKQMQEYGFWEHEEKLFDNYLEFEKELKKEIQANIRRLQGILPKEYILEEDDSRYFSWSQIDRSQLVNYSITKDSRIFKRNSDERESPKVKMFETIIIDRSWSMGGFNQKDSSLRNAIKAAVIRAKTLEYFDVDFSIILFDDKIDEVMEFWEKLSSKKTLVPVKLMRAVQEAGVTNISKPLLYTKEKLLKYSKKHWKKTLWNITFIWDGSPTYWLEWDELVWLIKDIRKTFSITAINIIKYMDNNNGELEMYFWDKDTWWTIVTDDISNLSKLVADNFNKNIKKLLRRIEKMQ